MPATYENIATTTLTSAQSSVTFSTISGNFTDLILVSNIKGSTTGAYLYIRVNGDSGSNYSYTRIYGNGSSAASDREASKTFMYGNGASGMLASTNAGFLQVNTHFMNYSNTTTNKTILIRDGLASHQSEAWVHLWRSTSAITSIECSASTGNFAADSNFTLYGIKAA